MMHNKCIKFVTLVIFAWRPNRRDVIAPGGGTGRGLNALAENNALVSFGTGCNSFMATSLFFGSDTEAKFKVFRYYFVELTKMFQLLPGKLGCRYSPSSSSILEITSIFETELRVLGTDAAVSGVTTEATKHPDPRWHWRQTVLGFVSPTSTQSS